MFQTKIVDYTLVNDSFIFDDYLTCKLLDCVWYKRDREIEQCEREIGERE